MPPANDDWAAASTLAGNAGTVTGSNVGASLEAGEPAAPVSTGGRSVWWKWTAAADGVLTVDTFGSSFDTVLDAFIGATLATLTSVAANDDDPANAPQSRISFAVTSGTTYSIRVDGFRGATGTINLDWVYGPPLPPSVDIVVVGASTSVWTSSDRGVTWLHQAAAGSGSMSGVVYTGRQFVAVGSSGSLIQTSTDVATWTPRATPFDGGGGLKAIEWDGGLFMAVGHGAGGGDVRCVLMSPDGVTWNGHSSSMDGEQASGVAHAIGIWVVVATTIVVTEAIHTSPDGITWTPRSSPLDGGSPENVRAGGGIFVAVGSPVSIPEVIFTSSDGITWTARSSPLDGTNALDAAWNGSSWMVGGDGAVVMSSDGGVSWVARGAPFGSGGMVDGLAWDADAGLWVAAGYTLVPTTGKIATSPDGITWTVQVVTGAAMLAVCVGEVVSPISVVQATAGVRGVRLWKDRG